MAPRRWPGIWLNASTDYVCTGNFLLKRHPYTIPFLDLWINSGDVVPELKPFHTWFSWEQRPLNALVRSWGSARDICACSVKPSHVDRLTQRFCTAKRVDLVGMAAMSWCTVQVCR